MKGKWMKERRMRNRGEEGEGKFYNVVGCKEIRRACKIY